MSRLEVVVGDIIVVRLHLSERLLVVPHEVVDVQILSFFNLVNIHLLYHKRGPRARQLDDRDRGLTRVRTFSQGGPGQIHVLFGGKILY